MHRALVALRDGNHVRATSLLGELKSHSTYPGSQFAITLALLGGDVDLALDHLERGLMSTEFTVFNSFDAPHLKDRFPDFYHHPRRAEILRSAGLDRQSLERIVIPPLPL